MALAFSEGYNVLLYAWEQTSEERLYQRWISGIHERMSYDEFKRKVGYKSFISQQATAQKITPQTQEEILSNVKEVLDGTVYSSR